MVTSTRKDGGDKSTLRSVPQLFTAFWAALRISDLRNRILFTLGALILFRLMAHITLPGVDLTAFQDVFDNNPFLGFFNIFSGGALQNLSIASLGVYPYITASIVIQILTPVIPRMRELSQEGESGRAKLTRYTHYLTIPLAFAYGWGQLNLLAGTFGNNSVANFGFGGDTTLNTLTILFVMVASTMFLVWLGELITEKGIGNGISLIIFAGIVATIPSIATQLWILFGQQPFQVILLIVIVLVILYFVVYVTEAQRRIPVQYGRNVFRSGRMYKQTGASYIPLRVNAAGMIPLIFAFAIISLPSVIAGFFLNLESGSTSAISNIALWITNNFGPTGWPYWILLFIVVVIFAFIYTFVVYLQQNIAENLQKNGGFIPGIRPGAPTRGYLNGVIFRITWAGALFLGFIAISPWIAELITNVPSSTTLIQSTSLLIMVGVALDTLRQLEAQLMMRNYQDFAT